jgi:DNA-binding protein HU-beta
MNKQDFIDKVANNAGITKRQAKDAIDTLTSEVIKAVKKGKKVTFVGFGTYSRRRRKKRKGRNPKTGKEITIPAKFVPKFTAGKAFKDAVA